LTRVSRAYIIGRLPSNFLSVLHSPPSTFPSINHSLPSTSLLSQSTLNYRTQRMSTSYIPRLSLTRQMNDQGPTSSPTRKPEPRKSSSPPTSEPALWYGRGTRKGSGPQVLYTHPVLLSHPPRAASRKRSRGVGFRYLIHSRLLHLSYSPLQHVLPNAITRSRNCPLVYT
jgi:hypothetical protein